MLVTTQNTAQNFKSLQKGDLKLNLMEIGMMIAIRLLLAARGGVKHITFLFLDSYKII